MNGSRSRLNSPTPPDFSSGLARVTAVFLVLYICGVFYLSWFPFDFQNHGGTPPMWWIPIAGRRMVFDFLINILFYIPLGAAAALTFGAKWQALPAAVFIGAAISAVIEYEQFWLPSRYSTLDDLAANTLGTVAGVLAATLIFRSRFGLQFATLADTKRWRLTPVPGLFLFFWILWRMFPFFPAFGMPRIEQAFGQVLNGWDWVTFTDACFGFAILALQLGPSRWLAVAFAMLPAQVFLLDHTLSLPAILGSAAGCGFGFILRYSAPGRWLAAASLVWLLLEELHPFHFRSIPTPIQWRPFATLVGLNSTGTYQILFGKLFLYTAVVWCFRRRLPPSHPDHGQRMGWAISIGCPMLVLAVGEWSQQWIEGRVPESTDLVILAIGSAMLAVATHFTKSRRVPAAQATIP